MKWVRATTGRLSERPHYAPDELDRECESLLRAGLRHAATFPLATDDLTVLLESHTSDLDLFADLASERPGVEGLTEFTTRGRPRVWIAASLSDSPAKAHRLRTTLAHELAHVRFHAFLFSGAGLQGIRCLRDSIARPRQTDWLEWQAAYATGAILMPLAAVHRAASAQLDGRPTPLFFRSEPARRLTRAVARAFDVSESAARVRLLQLHLLTRDVPTALRARYTPSLAATLTAAR